MIGWPNFGEPLPGILLCMTKGAIACIKIQHPEITSCGVLAQIDIKHVPLGGTDFSARLACLVNFGRFQGSSRLLEPQSPLPVELGIVRLNTRFGLQDIHTTTLLWEVPEWKGCLRKLPAAQHLEACPGQVSCSLRTSRPLSHQKAASHVERPSRRKPHIASRVHARGMTSVINPVKPRTPTVTRTPRLRA